MEKEVNSKMPNNLKERIVEMVNRIDNEALLNRIYRFVKYIYIHKS